ncbi:MAG: hypothetical protein QOH94_1935, partial [Mycobacterium sp.]|nr:hypothetical protein [Mycobacterium sp.]
MPSAPLYWGRVPVSPALHQAPNTACPRSTTHRHRRSRGAGAATVRAHLVGLAVVAPAVVGRADLVTTGLVDLAITDLVDLVDLVTTGPADLAVPATTDLAARAGLVT